jgi:hypothetical protein
MRYERIWFGAAWVWLAAAQTLREGGRGVKESNRLAMASFKMRPANEAAAFEHEFST